MLRNFITGARHSLAPLYLFCKYKVLEISLNLLKIGKFRTPHWELLQRPRPSQTVVLFRIQRDRRIHSQETVE